MISHPIQHFAPLFAALAREPEIELRVFYCCDWGVNSYADPGFGQTFRWDVPLLEGYESEFLPIGKRPRDLGFLSIDNPNVTSRLAAFDPHAVWIHGYSQRTSWRAYLWAVRNRRDILYFGDSELLAPRGLLVRGFKRVVLPTFFARCTAFLTIGDNNEAYYRHYGVPVGKMFRGSFPVDVSRFREVLLTVTEELREKHRKRFGLEPGALVALFVGKFINIKRPSDVVLAINRLRDELPQLQALMLGSGPLESEIRQQVEQLGLQCRVLLAGFINQAEMPLALRMGDFLIMSSEVDPHPLAVSEAMSVGNAIIASDRVGCVGPTDAAREGQNAMEYPCGDLEALCRCISTLARDPSKLARYQARSLELSANQDVSVMVDAVLRALQGCRQ